MIVISVIELSSNGVLGIWVNSAWEKATEEAALFCVLDLRVAEMLSHIGEVDIEQVMLPVVVAQRNVLTVVSCEAFVGLL